MLDHPPRIDGRAVLPILTLLMAGALLTPAPLVGQEPNAHSTAGIWSIDIRGGLAIPTGDLADIQNPGPSFGAGAGYAFTPQLSARVDVDLNFMEGETLQGDPVIPRPGLDGYHLLGGISYRLTDPGSSVFFDLYGGIGLVLLSFDGVERDETEFDYALAAKVGTVLSDGSDLAVRAKLHGFDGGDDGTWSLGQIQVVYQLRP